MLLEDAIRCDPQVAKNLEVLNSQYTFKDEVPKRELIVKVRDDCTADEMRKLRYSLM